MAEEQPSFSNYPRYSPVSETRPPGIYFDTLGPAWDMVKQDLANWIASVLVAGVLGYGLLIAVSVVVGFFVPERYSPVDASRPEFMVIPQLANVIPSTVVNCFMAGLIVMAVKQARGATLSIADVFSGFRRFGQIFIVTLIYSATIVFYMLVTAVVSDVLTKAVLAVVFGLAMIVAFVWLYPTYVFIGPRMVLSDMTLGEAFRDVYSRVTRHCLGFLALSILLGLMLLLSLAFCLIPFLFALPVYFAVLGMHYRFFFDEEVHRMAPPATIGNLPPV